MPNVSGEYTLAEAASKLGVSPAWIGKIRKLTNIGGSLGTQGKKSNFSNDDLMEFQEAHRLRLLNYSYEDIKKIYEIEEALLKFSVGKDAPSKKMPLLIHQKELRTGKDNILNKEYGKLFREYRVIMEQFAERVKKLNETAKEETSKSDIYSKLIERISKRPAK